MQDDFHYYIIYAIARKAGHSARKAGVLAHSSQFVDDNNEHQFIRLDPALFRRRSTPVRRYHGKETITAFPSVVYVGRRGEDKEAFHPIMTQSLSFNSLDPLVHRYVYMPFHYLPGDRPIRLKRKLNPYSCVADSRLARDLLNEAIRSGDPYRLGIALHTYADTWSHQNFTGFRERWNSLESWRRPRAYITPDIGHADVGRSPDEISKTWRDDRLEKAEVDNRQRAMQAIEAIFRRLARGRPSASTWTSVRDLFDHFVGAANRSRRIATVRSHFRGELPEYDAAKWHGNLIKKRSDGFYIEKSMREFTREPWYRFQRAARQNLNLVLKLTNEL
jgi:hypothetical protein